jgi:uncharacterized protein YaiL (DUF2058 family)
MSLSQQSTQRTATDAASSERARISQLIKMMKMTIASVYNDVWNSTDLTPQEIVEAWGTDAQALFTLSYELQQIIAQADPSYVILNAPNAVTFPGDGSAVIGEPIQ